MEEYINLPQNNSKNGTDLNHYPKY
jgi:hypothetical protein